MPRCTLLGGIYHDHPGMTLARIGLRQHTRVPGKHALASLKVRESCLGEAFFALYLSEDACLFGHVEVELVTTFAKLALLTTLGGFLYEDSFARAFFAGRMPNIRYDSRYMRPAVRYGRPLDVMAFSVGFLPTRGTAHGRAADHSEPQSGSCG